MRIEHIKNLPLKSLADLVCAVDGGVRDFQQGVGDVSLKVLLPEVA
jgi:hypothetical protein